MIDRARELMEESVKLRMVSDVPLGLFLSGGLDSSAITAFASRNSAERVKTFTIGFENSKFYDQASGRQSGSAEIPDGTSHPAG